MTEQRTRDRVLDAGMRLFGEKGYAATTVAEIEAAAGLSPGSGSLYRHFPSKQALLAEGVERRIAEGRRLLDSLADPPPAPADLTREASTIVEAALRRLENSGDLNRMIVKDLNQFPELMDRVRLAELAPVYAAVAQWITARSSGSSGPNGDEGPSPQALASVLVGATAHYWLLQDSFGVHPSGVSKEEFIAASAAVADAVLKAPG